MAQVCSGWRASTTTWLGVGLGVELGVELGLGLGSGSKVHHHRRGVRGVEPVLAATQAVELGPAWDALLGLGVRVRASHS